MLWLQPLINQGQFSREGTKDPPRGGMGWSGLGSTLMGAPSHPEPLQLQPQTPRETGPETPFLDVENRGALHALAATWRGQMFNWQSFFKRQVNHFE